MCFSVHRRRFAQMWYIGPQRIPGHDFLLHWRLNFSSKMMGYLPGPIQNRKHKQMTNAPNPRISDAGGPGKQKPSKQKVSGGAGAPSRENPSFLKRAVHTRIYPLYPFRFHMSLYILLYPLYPCRPALSSSFCQSRDLRSRCF